MEWDARSIVAIVKACRASGVTKFKLDSLEISFLEKQDTIDPVQEIIGTGYDQVVFTPEKDNPDDLMISDPLAYENMALGDELSD